MSTILPPLPSEKLAGIKILLASGSPRRRELLGMIVPEFEIAPGRDIDESYPSDMAPEEVPAYLSRLKAKAYADILEPGELIITADTIVICEGAILGKPRSRDAAVDMLRMLSGRTHTVVTGVTLSSTDRSETFAEHTQVHFAELADSQIEEYVDLYRPYDKAGAYGIQEWIGATGISGINGCFYNVMGLPLAALYRHLCSF